MKKNKKAFPIYDIESGNTPVVPDKIYYTGMDLLDYFATEAMHSFISNDKEEQWSCGNIAKFSYDMAEAMIKEKNKRENDNG